MNSLAAMASLCGPAKYTKARVRHITSVCVLLYFLFLFFYLIQSIERTLARQLNDGQSMGRARLKICQVQDTSRPRGALEFSQRVFARKFFFPLASVFRSLLAHSCPRATKFHVFLRGR